MKKPVKLKLKIEKNGAEDERKKRRKKRERNMRRTKMMTIWERERRDGN